MGTRFLAHFSVERPEESLANLIGDRIFHAVSDKVYIRREMVWAYCAPGGIFVSMARNIFPTVLSSVEDFKEKHSESVLVEILSLTQEIVPKFVVSGDEEDVFGVLSSIENEKTLCKLGTFWFVCVSKDLFFRDFIPSPAYEYCVFREVGEEYVCVRRTVSPYRDQRIEMERIGGAWKWVRSVRS